MAWGTIPAGAAMADDDGDEEEDEDDSWDCDWDWDCDWGVGKTDSPALCRRCRSEQ